MHTSKEEHIHAAIDSLYAAVSDEDQWPTALHHVALAFDTPRIAILRAPPGLDGLYQMRSLNHDAETQRLYQQYYCALDPSHQATRNAPVGKWLDTPDLYDPRTTPQPEYMDFAVRRGIRWVAGGKVHADKSSVTILGLQRPQDHKPFDAESAVVFRRLASHIGRASALCTELRSADMIKGLALSALDRLHLPVFAVDAQLKLLFSNAIGECLLADGVPFSLLHGCVHARDPDIHLSLASAVRSACEKVGAGFSARGKGQHWLVRVTPVPEYVGSAVICASPTEVAPAPAEILAQLLGFTRSEATVAYMLAEGSTAKEIAFARNVSINTVRTQLRQIMQKAGVRRQADLAKTLATIPR